MEEKNENQDVDLENNEGQTPEEESKDKPEDSGDNEETPQKSEREKDLEAEVGKLKRLLNKKDKASNKVEPQSKSDSLPEELDYGQKAFLKTYGIQGSDELTLVKSFQSRTGDDLDSIVSDDIFLGKLKNLRDARESAAAVPKGKSRSGQSAVTDVELAIAKFNETGELPDDFETRNKVVDSFTEKERGKLFNFKPYQ